MTSLSKLFLAAAGAKEQTLLHVLASFEIMMSLKRRAAKM